MENLLKAINNLKEIFFPEILIGELVSYRQNDDGTWTRSNKDKCPTDRDFIPNKKVDVIPIEQLEKAGKLILLSNFNKPQLEFVFQKLDNYLEKFELIKLENFVNFDRRNIDFTIYKDDIQKRRNELIENYYNFKKEILITQSLLDVDNQSKTKSTKFKTKYSVEELAYFFNLLIEQGVIKLEDKQKTKFYEFVVSNFESKDKTDISLSSFRNKSYSPSLQSIDNVLTDVIQMMQTAKEDKNKD
ncbi:hypothetical protein OBK23_03270 [Empedobacter falsenii]|uniref:hypothetical protein n=1 Tax=Empedobacter falsenii TaxID=343874 RepID=UPI003A7F7D28